MNTQHRPRIDADIAATTCEAAITKGKAAMKALRDLHPKLDTWKIKARMTELASLEDTFNKFRAFAPGLDQTPFLQQIGRPR